MLREAKFVLSHGQYAIDPDGLRTAESTGGVNGTSFWCYLDAVWFRRRRGVTVACIGVLWDIQRPCPADAAQFLQRHDDGRYGGDCKGRWDGERYWGAEEPEVAAAHLEVLRPMLENYPTCPPAYDGWYVFEKRPAIERTSGGAS
jgi:hypothetical protein